jgi:phenylacetate-coenzyme A ligase PaaK-like adenylate-forming protein
VSFDQQSGISCFEQKKLQQLHNIPKHPFLAKKFMTTAQNFETTTQNCNNIATILRH